MGQSVAASARSSHSILAASRRVLILMAARQAMDAQMPRRRSSSEAPRSSPSAISRISNRIFSRSGGADGGGRGFYGDGAVAERLGLEAGGVQLVGDAGVIDLLLGVSCTISGISRRCISTRPAARCFITCSNRMRSCATCWSMIHRPSRPAAMMKLS